MIICGRLRSLTQKVELPWGGYKNYLELKYSSGGLDGVRSTK